MPELPEVENVVLGLKTKLKNQLITKIVVRREGLRQPFPVLDKTVGAKISEVSRRAKYILMQLDDDTTLIWHLGMSGRLNIFDKKKNYKPLKHDHLLMETPLYRVVLNDPRRFGLVDLVKTRNLNNYKFLRDLGIEPLDKGFTTVYLHKQLAHKKMPIKQALMDQKVVVGIGNIYASEALFKAKISPLKAANSLTLVQLELLIAEITKVLREAIKLGGSSLRDYVKADGKKGDFQKYHLVYGKAGEDCPVCSRKIQRIVQGGRATFYCAKCQK